MGPHRSFAIWLFVLGIGVCSQGKLQSPPSGSTKMAQWIIKDSKDDQMIDGVAPSSTHSVTHESSFSMNTGDQQVSYDKSSNLNEVLHTKPVQDRMKRAVKGGGGKGGGGKGGGGKGGGGKGGGGKGGGGKGGDGKGLTKAQLEAIKSGADAAKAVAELEKKRREQKGGK